MEIREIIPIPNLLSGLVLTFLAILVLRITYPIIDFVLNTLTWNRTEMRIVAVLVFYLIVIFVFYFAIWIPVFGKPNTGGAQNG